MNIKEYYKSISIAALNISIFAALLSVVVFVVMSRFLHSAHVWETTVPFMLLSCVFFIQFHISKRHYERVPEDIEASEKPFLEERNVLMAFMPAPTLRIVLFNPKGQYVGEIKDLNASWYKWFIPNNVMMLFPQSYILLDEQQKQLATFKAFGFLGKNIAIFNSVGKRIAVYEENLKKSLFRYIGVLYDDEGTVRMNVNVSGFLQSFMISSAEDKKLVSFQKGYMPLEWSSRFKELNTPILTFSEEIGEEDMICIYALCAKLLNYTKN